MAKRKSPVGFRPGGRYRMADHELRDRLADMTERQRVKVLLGVVMEMRRKQLVHCNMQS